MGFYATHVWDVEEHSVSWDELQCPIMHLIPTRNRMDFVWVILRRYIELQLTDKLPNIEIGAIGQRVANGIALMVLPL